MNPRSLRRSLTAGGFVAAALTLLLMLLMPSASAAAPSAHKAAPDLLGCKTAPTPEVPGRGVVGFFESGPDKPPAWSDPFAPGSTTSIYEQYGYAGLRWNTYDLGCGPEVARSPDAAVGTAVANWIIALPKAAVAATGAVLGAAFAPDFLGAFDPIISTVVDTLRHAIFEQWFAVVVAALGLFVIWRARQASLASTAAAIGWALLVMVVVTMVFRWPLVAGHAADETVTTTLGAVTGGLNDKAPDAQSDAGTEATAGMHEALLYQAWLGGTFGDTNSEVARRYGPVIFDATALTWSEAQTLKTNPAEGKKIIEAKEKKFTDAATQIQNQDPDAYQYLTGQRSDSRVGYALLAGLATLCAVPFLFVAGLLVLGALVIVRFGVMLFPAFATLGLFPTMRSLVTGIGSTVAAALINAMVFGIGAAVTVLAMGILLGPENTIAPWLDIILMLLLTIVMWVALRPFRRLTQMVAGQRNHFAAASEGVSTVGRSAARTSSRILTTALGTFLGVSASQRGQDATAQAQPDRGVPQRAEAITSYEPIPIGAEMAEGATIVAPPAALAGTMQVNAGSVTVTRTVEAASPPVEAPGEIYSPRRTTTAGSRTESVPAAAPAGRPTGETETTPGGGRFEFGARPTPNGAPPNGTSRRAAPSRAAAAPAEAATQNAAHRAQPAPFNPAEDGRAPQAPGDRGFQRSAAEGKDDFDLDELNEIFRPGDDRVRNR
jgi:hypothetical protein